MSKTRKFKRIQRLRHLFRGRKKTGRNVFSYTIALTYKQIEWLTERYTNASEIFRRLLDDHIKSMDKVEPDVVKLGYKLKRLVAEKEAKEAEKHTYWSDNEKIERDFYSMKDKERLYRVLLQTPEDQIKMAFPKKDDVYPEVTVTVVDPSNGEKLYWSLQQAKHYSEKRRQDVLDVIKREIKYFNEYEKKDLEQLRRDKAVFDAVQAAFDENIRLLEEEINKVTEEISLINKQTNKDS